ncbi:MAG: hypothetical protein K9N35_11905, partial [Candidatus Marinimicrobia bacterium]|nr:hypothetical protein [Candidatus Neomarinimicrobiota bacterium]
MTNFKTYSQTLKNSKLFTGLIIYTIQKKTFLFTLLFALSSVSFSATSISITAQSDISGSMNVNTIDNGMLSFTLTMAGNGGDITLDSVTVDLTGTAVDADIAAVKVYKDAG